MTDMDTLDFFIRFNILIILLIFVYDLLIASTVYHQFKRLFLNIVPVVALLVAAFSILDWSTTRLFSIALPLQEIQSVELYSNETSWSWSEMFMGVWIMGCLVQLSRFILDLFQMNRYLNDESHGASFTFLQRIHIDPSLDADAKKKVALHEQVHADQWHSIDLIWYSILGIFFWFNPFVAMGRAALKDVHEYIADAETNLRSNNYTNTLLASAFGLSTMPMANEFNSINVKNRIRMLKMKRTTAQRNRIIGALAAVMLIATTVACTTINDEGNNGKIYEKVDQMPRFTGCENKELEGEALDKCALNELYSFMGNNIMYPKSAEKEDVEGKVLIKFVIDENGTVTQAKVKEGIDSRLDAEALRVIESMPAWTPGVHEGKNVKVEMTLPIMFKLTD